MKADVDEDNDNSFSLAGLKRGDATDGDPVEEIVDEASEVLREESVVK